MGSGRKKSKSKRNSEKTLSSVKKLEISQINTDTQLKIIAENQREIKSLFMNAQSTINTVKESMNDLHGKHEINENTVRVIQEGIVSNTLAIKSNFEIAKEHNLLIEKRLDMLAKQEREYNEIIDAKQDLLAKQEREHNELIEAKLDMLAKREKETCSPPKPIVQSLVIEDKSN